MINVRKIYEISMRPEGVYGFLASHVQNGSKVLDVGCGNDSAYYYKKAFPFMYYIGLDIQDYRNTKKGSEDELLICKSEEFSETIGKIRDIDIVISRHNLEHCAEPLKVVKAISDCVKPGGVIFFAFPSQKSVKLPSRKITLNYYDDPTHKPLPPNVSEIVQILNANDVKVLKIMDPYQPLALRTLGAIQEPFSALSGKVLQGTWSFHGSETIIWAQKNQ